MKILIVRQATVHVEMNTMRIKGSRAHTHTWLTVFCEFIVELMRRQLNEKIWQGFHLTYNLTSDRAQNGWSQREMWTFRPDIAWKQPPFYCSLCIGQTEPFPLSSPTHTHIHTHLYLAPAMCQTIVAKSASCNKRWKELEKWKRWLNTAVQTGTAVGNQSDQISYPHHLSVVPKNANEKSFPVQKQKTLLVCFTPPHHHYHTQTVWLLPLKIEHWQVWAFGATSNYLNFS